jgi:nicotinamide-nucleotide amidase
MLTVNASIITIGDELLIGQVTDTNSPWMAQALNTIGVWVNRRVAVGDNWDDIWNALDEESKHAEIILITGGLGPTADDITKPLLCKYFGGQLVTNEKVLAHIIYLFEKIFKRPPPILDRNLQQADVPDVCTVLHNARGTAPGMWFEKEGKIFISMPGVPSEMKGIMNDHVLQLLPQHFSLPAITSKTLLTFGVGESFLAERIKDFECALPTHIKLAYLPNYGMVRLRLTGTGSYKEALEKELTEQFVQLQTLVADVLVTNTDDPMEVVVGKLLQAKGKTMGTAESCTGGYIAQLITSHAGSSAYYKGSIVSYHNDLKKSLLGVTENTLATEGAVSEATVLQMAKGALKALQTDYVLAVSGIMGPEGGTPEKPVGTVWIAAGHQQKIITHPFNCRFDRSRNISIAAMYALNLLREVIVKEGS